VDGPQRPGIRPPPPNPSNEAWVRHLAPSFKTEKGWANRDPVNKAMFALSGAADRIGASPIFAGAALFRRWAVNGPARLVRGTLMLFRPNPVGHREGPAPPTNQWTSTPT
jgi:hypothetical protein